MKIRVLLACALLSLFATLAANLPSKEVHGAHGITLPPPPPTAAKPVTDEVSGHSLTDPYRWLEDQDSPETRAWIDSQMRYTQQYLSQVKIRPEIVKRLTELEHVETVGIPIERNEAYFYNKRLPDENQASIYIRRALHGSDERLIDATKLSADQNTSVHIEDISKDAGLLVYGVREGGADEQTVHLLDVPNRKELEDVLPRARYSGVSLAPDSKGLYYSKYEPTGTIVYFHRIGSAVDSDQLVFGKEYKGEKFGQMQLISAEVTENGRYLIVTVSHGVPAKRVDIYAKDLRTPDAELREMIHGIDSRFTPVNYGDDLYVLTDYQAEDYRVLKVSMNEPAAEKWHTVVPESKDVISDISIVGGKLFVTGLHDVVTQTRVFTLDGKQTGTITYPTLGSASEVHGREDSKHAFYSFESFNIPPAIYHYDVETG